MDEAFPNINKGEVISFPDHAEDPRDEIVSLISKAEQLLKEAENEEEQADTEELSDFLLGSESERASSAMSQIRLRRSAEEKRKQVESFKDRVTELKKKYYPELYQPEVPTSREVSLEAAEQIMGRENVLGPDDVEKVFGTKLDSVPPIPFSKEELTRAKELEQQLVLQVNTMVNKLGGSSIPITPMSLSDFLKSTQNQKEGGIIFTRSWQNRVMYEQPRRGWKLVSRGLLPKSTKKNYLEQTEHIVEYLTKRVFKDGIPDEYQEAISEFDQESEKITKAMVVKPEEASRLLFNLKITRLTREQPVEVLYRLILQNAASEQKVFTPLRIWTNTSGVPMLGDGGQFAYVDVMRPFLFVGGEVCSERHSQVGACFSRMK